MRNRDHRIDEVNDENHTGQPDVIIFEHYLALKVESKRIDPTEVCRISLQVKGLHNNSHSSLGCKTKC
jgi:hypothetical protein